MRKGDVLIQLAWQCHLYEHNSPGKIYLLVPLSPVALQLLTWVVRKSTSPWRTACKSLEEGPGSDYMFLCHLTAAPVRCGTTSCCYVVGEHHHILALVICSFAWQSWFAAEQAGTAGFCGSSVKVEELSTWLPKQTLGLYSHFLLLPLIMSCKEEAGEAVTGIALGPNPASRWEQRFQSCYPSEPGLPAPPGDNLSPVPHSFLFFDPSREVQTFLRRRRSVRLCPPCARSGGVRSGTRCASRSEPIYAAGGPRGPIESQPPPPPCSSGTVSWQPPVATAPPGSVISVRSRAVSL